LLGVDNIAVVTTDDAVLVARRDDGDGLRRVNASKTIITARDRETFVQPKSAAAALKSVPSRNRGGDA